MTSITHHSLILAASITQLVSVDEAFPPSDTNFSLNLPD